VNTSDDYDFKVMVSELSLLDRVGVGGIVIRQWLDRISHLLLRSLFGFLLGRVSLCSLYLISWLNMGPFPMGNRESRASTKEQLQVSLALVGIAVFDLTERFYDLTLDRLIRRAGYNPEMAAGRFCRLLVLTVIVMYFTIAGILCTIVEPALASFRLPLIALGVLFLACAIGEYYKVIIPAGKLNPLGSVSLFMREQALVNIPHTYYCEDQSA
jgi:hypothetical protein